VLIQPDQMKFIVSLAFLTLCLCSVYAHSWVQCADYTQENANSWNAGSCRGWPRGYNRIFQQASYQFGADVGYNYQPSENKACRDPPASNDYTSTYPAATYASGQRVCLAWPAKNHVAANCTNQYIPDNGVKVYRSGVNPSSDLSLSGFRQNLIADLGAASGGNQRGFQHCPSFCSNMDKAFCEGCFALPSLASGKYTFLWLWAFNSNTDLYSSCWDITIR